MFEIENKEQDVTALPIKKAYPLDQRMPDRLAALLEELRRVETAEIDN
jgi:hypothetical protein